MSERNFREKSKNCKILSMVLQNHTKLWNAIRNGIVMIKMANDEQEQLAKKKRNLSVLLHREIPTWKK